MTTKCSSAHIQVTRGTGCAPPKGTQGKCIHASFCSPRHHDISVATAYQVVGIPDRISTCCTRCGGCPIGPPQPMPDADRPRRRVGQYSCHQEWAYPADQSALSLIGYFRCFPQSSCSSKMAFMIQQPLRCMCTKPVSYSCVSAWKARARDRSAQRSRSLSDKPLKSEGPCLCQLGCAAEAGANGDAAGLALCLAGRRPVSILQAKALTSMMPSGAGAQVPLLTTNLCSILGGGRFMAHHTWQYESVRSYYCFLLSVHSI